LYKKQKGNGKSKWNKFIIMIKGCYAGEAAAISKAKTKDTPATNQKILSISFLVVS